MTPSEKKKLLAGLAMLPPLLLVGLVFWLRTLSTYEWDAVYPPAGAQRYVWHGRYPLLIGLALVSTVGPLVGLLYTARARKRAITYFLDHLHARFWTSKGHRDPEYRVSLFVPAQSGAVLRCYYRTDGDCSTKLWSTRAPRDGRSADGVVGAVWLSGMTVHVGSPPERATEQESTEYRMRSHMSESVHHDRSWSCAAMLGVPIQSPRDGLPIAVLMIERDKPEAKIGHATLRDYEHDIQVCAMILQGRLS